MPLSGNLSKYATSLTALAFCAGLFAVIQPQKISSAEQVALADSFRFTQYQLPEPTKHPLKRIREVHPSLKRIGAWISATGASVAMQDLDSDGKNNDLIQIDPRTDEVAVMPVPSTGDRFDRFVLNHKGINFDPSKMAPMGAITADLNEDHRPDIVVYYWGRTPVAFLRNENTGLSASSFTSQELVPGNEIWNTSCGAIADFDGDGHNDLFFCNYYQDGAKVLDAQAPGTIQLQESIARALNGGKKHLLRFVAATPESVQFAEHRSLFSDQVDRGWTIAVGVCDLDGDLLPEIYLANDTGPDRLLHNDSQKNAFKFSLVEGRGGLTTPTSFVLGNDSFKGMGIDFGDLNKDGVPDIYVSNIAAPFGLEESHFVWLSNDNVSLLKEGIAPYTQASESLGLSRSGWSWDCRLADFNNDGQLEAVQATGFLKGQINRWPELQAIGTSNSTILSNPANWPGFGLKDDVSGHEQGCFFAKAPNGKFYDIAKPLGLGNMQVSRGIALGDVDADGDVDMVVANQWGPSYFYKNECNNAQQGLSLRLSDNRGTAIGARVTVTQPDGTKQLALVDGGSGHSGKRAQEVHFGLGRLPDATKVKVSVEWRGADAKVRHRDFALAPGWHDLNLDAGDKA